MSKISKFCIPALVMPVQSVSSSFGRGCCGNGFGMAIPNNKVRGECRWISGDGLREGDGKVAEMERGRGGGGRGGGRCSGGGGCGGRRGGMGGRGRMGGRGGGGRGRMGFQRGRGMMGGRGGGSMVEGRNRMRETIHNLLDNHEVIERKSFHTENGIEATTTSEDPQVANWIKTHVRQMKELKDEGGYIRRWDELFATALDLRDFHDMDVDYLDDGVHVVQFAKDDIQGIEFECAKAIVQAHAGVVDKFVEIGYEEARKNHPVPEGCNTLAQE